MAEIRYRRIRPEAQLFLFQQAAALLASGAGAGEALATLQHDLDDPSLEALVGALAGDVAGGSSVSDAFARHPQLFGPELVQLVRTGEREDRLAVVLAAIAASLEPREVVRRNRKRMLVIPLAMLVVLFVIISVIMIFVIPAFKSVYASFGADLPGPTLVLLAVSDFAVDYWWAVVIAAVGAYFGFRRLRRSRDYGLTFDRLLLKLPTGAAVIRLFFLAEVCSTLAAACRSSLPLAPTVGFLRAAARNRELERVLSLVEQALLRGTGLVAALRESGGFPARLIKMLEIGERSGKLADTFAQASEMYGKEASQALFAFEEQMTLAIYLILGIVVGVTIIGLYLPIFKLGAAV